MKLLVQSVFYVGVLTSILGQTAAHPQLRHHDHVGTFLAGTVDLWPGLNVSTSTFNKIYHDNGVVNVIIPCLVANNTQDPYCGANVENSGQSDLPYAVDILLTPNAKYANPREQVQKALKDVDLADVYYIWVDVSYPPFWAGPATANQLFLKDFLKELSQCSGFDWNYFGIMTDEGVWTDVMGSWNYPSSQGMWLWNVLLDGHPSKGPVNFGGWTSVVYKQYLIKQTLCSLTVNYDYGDFSLSSSKKKKFQRHQ
eukprot:gb/GECG01004379.1/.p1 GENE.gb/GECG01004379.1/~~gb/GECG01004379.1/.p1  ORF type:complete len:254 (+),score=18.83 gb/GECG01004379.1/:1-762(+)